MTFTFTNEDGETVRSLVQCDNCGYIQLDRHFGDDDKCPMCLSHGTTKLRSVTSSSGVSSFQYRNMLTILEDDCSGVGSATAGAINDEYDGDEFVAACKDAYDEQDWDGLTRIRGIGESTARDICLYVAEMRDWEDGKAEFPFEVA